MLKHAQTQKIKTANTFLRKLFEDVLQENNEANQTEEDESSRKPGLIRGKQSRESLGWCPWSKYGEQVHAGLRIKCLRREVSLIEHLTGRRVGKKK